MPDSMQNTASSADHAINTDIIIIGGGIAGLWLLNRLNNEGYKAILFESGDLGGAQSVASQGMIHGGVKYALGGALTGSSEAIADMPDHWRRCLKGEGDVDLRQANVLSEHFYLWSTASLGSKVTSFFASKLTRGRADKVKPSDYPPHFQHDDFNGNIYKLVDLVMDTPSVLKALYDNYADRIFSIDWQQASWNYADSDNPQSDVTGLTLQHNGEQWHFNAKQIALTAGAGNEKLCESLGISSIPMQRRPLQQAIAITDYPAPLYAHCMGSNPSPRLTISCHPLSEKDNQVEKWAWYLGGDLATESTNLAPKALIEKAKGELQELFPQIDFSQADWSTIKLDRAEPKQKGLIKPDKAFAKYASESHRHNVIVAWPTKLTLSPNMADEVMALLTKQPIEPLNSLDLTPCQNLPKPNIAKAPWE